MSGTKSPHGGLTRRSFLKTTGAAAGAAAVLGTGAVGLTAMAEDASSNDSGEKVISTICRANCFQACMLNAHVRDGKVVKMSRADYPEDIYSGCCLRGLAMHERTYSDNRLKYPLKRVEGTERGAGEWERISWEQAIQEIADKIKDIQSTYGERAMTFNSASGNYGAVQGGAIDRLAYVTGGTAPAGMYDFAMGWGTNRVMGGNVFGYSNEPKDMVDAQHIIIWGTNPVWAQPQTWRIILAAKDNGARLYCIDPIRSATSQYVDEYIQIHCGTDLYVTLAILNEIVKNDRIDVEYAKQCTTSPFLIREDTGLFLRRSDIEGGPLASVRDSKSLNSVGYDKTDPVYVMDEATGQIALYTECEHPVLEGEFEVDGIRVKTAYTALKEHMAQYTVEDASELSGIPVETINKIIDIYASGDRVTAYTQFGIDHYRGGHLWGQALAILHALTNNLSRHGTGIGGPGAPKGALSPLGQNTAMGRGTNPIKADKVMTSIASCAWSEVVATGKFRGQDYPIKGYIGNCDNIASNRGGQRDWLDKDVKNLELIVDIDFEMTDTARYSDYVLPAAFWLECTDIRGNFSNPYIVYGEKCIDPLWECKTDNEISTLLAEALGVGEYYPPRTDEEWIDICFDSDTMRAKGFNQERIKKERALRCLGTPEEPWIIGGYGEEFPTQSGRAEIYNEVPTARYDYGQDWQSEAKLEQFPIWKEPYENWPGSEAKKKYPLSYLTLHERGRTHTQWFGCETLREIDPEPYVHVSPQDAESRGIEDMEIVEVFNDRGHCVIKAVIDNALPEGVCFIPKGWQMDQFIEGSFQEMTLNAGDWCAGGYVFYDATVEIRKWEE
ncbi:MAG TPA: molybdopterin-dependent oxidoreductase [Candidatus Aphodovivens excrementavium]|nr:molybdopterin-dependent oxidoreductase [Candidatus Aphodovivens excrementavium]